MLGWSQPRFVNKTEMKDLNVTIAFGMPKNIATMTNHYPQSIFSALAHLGGFIAIFRVGSLLNIFNRRKFEDEVVQEGEDIESEII